MTETAEAPTPEQTPKATGLKAWQQKRSQGGKITLPSGTEVRIEVPNIMEMVAAGTVPNDLVGFALKASEMAMAGFNDEIDIEQIREANSFYNWVVSATVKDPSLTPEEVKTIPYEDADMLFQFAMRNTDVDALGHQLHGLETKAAWKNFRLGRGIS